MYIITPKVCHDVKGTLRLQKHGHYVIKYDVT